VPSAKLLPALRVSTRSAQQPSADGEPDPQQARRLLPPRFLLGTCLNGFTLFQPNFEDGRCGPPPAFDRGARSKGKPATQAGQRVAGSRSESMFPPALPLAMNKCFNPLSRHLQLPVPPAHRSLLKHAPWRQRRLSSLCSTIWRSVDALWIRRHSSMCVTAMKVLVAALTRRRPSKGGSCSAKTTFAATIMLVCDLSCSCPPVNFRYGSCACTTDGKHVGAR
jgi:hypothetical protein